MTRYIAHILLFYFSFLNITPAAGIHVHHDGARNTVDIVTRCVDDGGKTGDAKEREDFTEHLFENGCIVAAVHFRAISAHRLLDVDADLARVNSVVPSVLYVTRIPAVDGIDHPPFPAVRSLRAPPSGA